MPTIKVPRSFYVKERTQVYGSWQEAFWRELIQNSVDAGSTELKIELQHSATMYTPEHPWSPGEFLDPQPMLRVSFQDNGPGMTKQVLEDVYMTLGASFKGEGAAGGFGRARILTCFSHPSWLLTSQDWTAQSTEDGTGYEVKKVRHATTGLLIEVMMEADMTELENALWTVVNQCQLPSVEFILNGLPMRGVARFAPVDLGDRLKTVIKNKATLYAASGGECVNHILVRVNGLIMFSKYLYASKDAKGYVLELEPKTSRSLLNASRDSAKEPLNTALESLVAELNRGNTDAAHDQAVEPKLIKIGDGGPRSHRVGIGKNYSLPEHMRARKARQVGKKLVRAPLNKEVAKEIIRALFDARKEERTQIILKAIIERSPVTIYLEGSATFMKVDANQKKWIDAAERWSPNNWRSVITDSGNVGWFPEHKVMAEQLKAWSLACEAGSAVLTMLTGASYFFYPGIVVTPTARGQRLTVDNQDGNIVHVLMFNPLEEDGDKFVNFFDLRTNDGLRELVAVALHEVVHMAVSQHNEAYAKLLTEMFSILNLEELMTVIRNRL